MSIAGFVFGVFTLFAWLLPVCDVPLAFIGIGLSLLGRQGHALKGMATAGLVFSIIALGLSVLLIFSYDVDAGLTPYVLQWMK